MLAQQENNLNNVVENSRLQSVVLEYKKSQKLIKASKIAIAVILILILVFSLVGWQMVNTSSSLAAAGVGSDFEYPYIGENVPIIPFSALKPVAKEKIWTEIFSMCKM